MHTIQLGRASFALALTAALAGGVTACGSSKSSSSSSSPSASSPASSPTTSASATKSGPGTGKPAVTIGDKNFTEENILGALYSQALQAQGYRVTLKDNIGSSEITDKALTAGQIDMYPEYTGTILSAVANQTKLPHSAAQAYSEAKAFEAKRGFAVLNATPFTDSDALASKPAYASRNHLRSIGDLAALGHSVKLGAAPEFATRFEGLVGIKQVYRVNPTFVPIAIGLTYKALDSGQVDVQDVFTTDPQLLTGQYRVLADPKGIFGFQNVAPVVSKKVLAAEGPDFASTLNRVSALLTLRAIQQMNQAASVNKESPASVASAFLKANNLS